MSESDGTSTPQTRDQQQTRDQVVDYGQPGAAMSLVTFDRAELTRILALYGRMVAAGEWRDYAIDFGRDRAVFSVFRRTAEVPLYRIEKDPRLARRQGAFSITNSAGLVLKRGQELGRVLQVLEPKPRLFFVV